MAKISEALIAVFIAGAEGLIFRRRINSHPSPASFILSLVILSC